MDSDFKNFFYPFRIDKGLGKVAEEADYAEHIRQLIIQVLFTNPGERINRPDFGCGLRRMVFAPNNDITANLTQIMVVQALDKWLGSVIQTDEVKVKSVNEILEVHISYTIKALQDHQYLNLEVKV